MINFLNRQVRITDPVIIDEEMISNELQRGSHVIVQFSESIYNAQLLQELNKLCVKYDDNFALRFFGHYQTIFNCNVLFDLPNIKSLYIDRLQDAVNLEALTSLNDLNMISIDILNLDNPDILRFENLKKLKVLIITSSKTTINLQCIKEYRELCALIVGGKIKNLEAIGDLAQLEFLSLNSISRTSLSFINNLNNLKTLKIIFGGRENINEIEENYIENLEVIRVRGLNNLDNLNRFLGLRSLLVEDQIQISEIILENNLEKLEKLRLLNCKKLKMLTGIEKLIVLQELRIYKTSIDFYELINKPLPKTLQIFGFYTAKAKEDNNIEKKLLKKGYRLTNQ